MFLERFLWFYLKGLSMTFSFRHTAGFGKRMEYYLIGQMLMEGLGHYAPLVNDHGANCVENKKEDGAFFKIQSG